MSSFSSDQTTTVLSFEPVTKTVGLQNAQHVTYLQNDQNKLLIYIIISQPVVCDPLGGQ